MSDTRRVRRESQRQRLQHRIRRALAARRGGSPSPWHRRLIAGFTRRRVLYLVVALFLVAVIVVPVYLTGNPTAAAIATAQVDATPAPTPAPVRSWAAPPTMAVKDTVKYTAVIQTSKGLIRAELAAADAPQLVNNFLFLTNQGFYSTGQKLNQVSANTRVDMGALNPDGTGGPGYSMDLPEARQPVPIGSLTFVADPSGKAGSRFAVTLATQPPGPVNLGVFGRVTDGLDIARQLTPEDTLIRVSVNTQNLTPLPPAAAPSPAPSVSPQAP